MWKGCRPQRTLKLRMWKPMPSASLSQPGQEITQCLCECGMLISFRYAAFKLNLRCFKLTFGTVALDLLRIDRRQGLGRHKFKPTRTLDGQSCHSFPPHICKTANQLSRRLPLTHSTSCPGTQRPANCDCMHSVAISI